MTEHSSIFFCLP